MSVWAVAMVKDEEDVIERVVRHVAAQGVDGIIVADNQSSDGTRGILQDLLEDQLGQTAMIVKDDVEVGYWQSRKMTALADLAHGTYHAEWVWPFDADEWWQHDQGSITIAEACRISPGSIIEAPLYHHLVTRLDPAGHPFDAMQYRTAEPSSIPKVIVRWHPGNVLHAGNHGCTESYPGGVTEPLGVEVRHFPYRSEDQFVRKALNGSRAYAATDLPWGTGQHWREYGLLYEAGGEQALRDAYQAHFVHDLPSAAGLVYDPVRGDA
jgi:hypothetical protein